MTTEERGRRAKFHDQENIKLDRFIGPCDDGTPIYWSRSYRCACGYTCVSPRDIWDHAQGCKEDLGP